LLLQQCKGSLNTPLHIALSRACYPISSMIIDYTQAGLSIRNVYGSIPLHIAVSNSRAKTVKKLVDASPVECLFAENGVGNTPLEVATLNVLLGRMTNMGGVSSSELGAQHVHTHPPRINLDNLKRDVPALRTTIAELLTNGPLKQDDKLTKELSSFARLMETKLVVAEADAAKAKKEDTSESEDKDQDHENREATLEILQDAVLTRSAQRQLIHLIDVQKSVGSHLNSAGNSIPWHQQQNDEEGLEPEEDGETKLRNSSIVYKRIGQVVEDDSR